MNAGVRSFIAGLVMLSALVIGLPEAVAQPVIVRADSAPARVRLGALEVRRYVYLRTGALLAISSEEAPGDAIVVAVQDAPEAQPVLASMPADFQPLGPQDFLLRTIVEPGARCVYLVGGSDIAVLYAAYRFAEVLGVRFYLHGDEMPDVRASLALPELDEVRRPLFELRGIQPFHDFPEGPDWWNPEDYQSIIAQLPKLRMNFFGLHTYPEDRPNAEPAVWIGAPGDVNADGSVAFAYPASWYNTLLPVNWGLQPKKTSQYACGAAALYDRDDYGSDVMRELTPRPEKQKDMLKLFARVGDQFADAFTLARALGVKTCMGTETPLVVPRLVAQRMDTANPRLRPDNGKPATFTAPIEGTEDDPLYQSVRYDLDAYRADVPNGVYKVTLHFVEPAYETAGARVFGVNIEGKPAIESLDVFATAGKNTAVVRTFENIEVADGRLDIEFVRQVEFPCIAAVAVEGAGVAYKVNCCGPAYQDYLGEDAAALTPEQIAALYEGMFTRIMRTHPLDYYWFWTPENWTWEGVTEEQVERTKRDILGAYDVAKKLNTPFQLATCGWVLGPQFDRSYLGKVLPPDMAVSCINRQVGHDPVEPGFAQVQGRGKWAIPWLEDDPAMTSPQLWVGRMRRDARDALAYGCNGLMGIHWRTRILGPNVAALAQAAWDQSSWSGGADTGGPVGGAAVTSRKRYIADTEADAVYRCAREGMDAYRFPVANGAYNVTLQFCEVNVRKEGQRVFTVRIEGAPVAEHLDLYKQAGRFRAYDLNFENIAVADGALNIDFTAEKGKALISGIVITGPETAIRVNCGGEAVGDYAADPAPIATHLPAADFYQDWAAVSFGPEVAEAAARIFSAVDGRLPRPSNWIGGPGGYTPDEKPWAEQQADYAFVDEFAALRANVTGTANLERFDYWMNTLLYLRATAEMRCHWNTFAKALKKAKAEQDPERAKRFAWEVVLPARVTLVRAVERVYQYLLATASTPGELGTIANLEQHTFLAMLEAPAAELETLLGEPLPARARLSCTYDGAPRLVVLTKRTALDPGETFLAKALLLDNTPALDGALHWRPLGQSEFKAEPIVRAGRNAFAARIAADQVPADGFEYYLEATTAGGQTVRWPVTAPDLNQTVIVQPK